MQFSGYSAAEVDALVLASRAALLQLDGELFSLKQSLRVGDGEGGMRPFDLSKLSSDDRSWVEGYATKVRRLNAALDAFGAALPNPASL